MLALRTPIPSKADKPEQEIDVEKSRDEFEMIDQIILKNRVEDRFYDGSAGSDEVCLLFAGL